MRWCAAIYARYPAVVTDLLDTAAALRGNLVFCHRSDKDNVADGLYMLPLDADAILYRCYAKETILSLWPVATQLIQRVTALLNSHFYLMPSFGESETGGWTYHYVVSVSSWPIVVHTHNQITQPGEGPIRIEEMAE